MASTLVINPGSSSRKYALYLGGRKVLDLAFESTNNGFFLCSEWVGSRPTCESITAADFEQSVLTTQQQVSEYLNHHAGGRSLDNVVVRVVAPGTRFQKHQFVDDQFVSELEKQKLSAPLHIPVVLQEIKSAKQFFKASKIIAASDSAFHATMPAVAREYSLPATDAKKYDIHRFGYHGLSVASVVRRVHSLIGSDPARLIVCHIGSGVSVTAVKNGKSVDTSMSFSPVAGLPMGSRGGDVDTSAILEIMRQRHWLVTDAMQYLNQQCGLVGLAKDSDIRRLLDRRSKRDSEATIALDAFVYHIQKSISAQTVALGGLDVFVLTATAALRSTTLRELVIGGLGNLGVVLSADRNDDLVGKEGVISARGSAVKVVVMHTDEMGEMVYVAEDVTRVYSGGRQS